MITSIQKELERAACWEEEESRRKAFRKVKESGIYSGDFSAKFEDGPIKSIFLMNNGMLAVFDQTGQQIPELQGHVLDLLMEKLESE